MQLGYLLAVRLTIHVVMACLATRAVFVCSLADCGGDVYVPLFNSVKASSSLPFIEEV